MDLWFNKLVEEQFGLTFESYFQQKKVFINFQREFEVHIAIFFLIPIAALKIQLECRPFFICFMCL